MRIHIAEASYGPDEIAAVVKVLETGRLALVAGERCQRFEARAADALDVPHTLLVNSGSSALLLAIAALELPAGSEVITPALTFGTTVAPLLQLGLVPVFVDVEPGRLVVDIDAVDAAISPFTKAIVVPDLVGDVPDWAALRALADAHGLALVDDAADTWAPHWADRSTASWADVGITSFYASHMLTLAGTGGLVATRDPALARRVQQLRGWGRRSALRGESEHDRAADLEGLAYDAKYVFDVAGYNLLPTEIGAAFGLVQLERMPSVRAARARHHAWLTACIADRARVAVLPPEARSTWHALAFRVDTGRDRIQAHLEASGIQTRPVMAGNLVRHPMVQRAPHRVVGSLANADAWMTGGLMIGCHQGLDDAALRHMATALEVLG